MLQIIKDGVSTIFVDIRKVSKEEILMIACHERRIEGNIAILTTYRNKGE